MTLNMLIALLVIMIASLGALWIGLKSSVRGYEDELGFHEGVEPSPLGEQFDESVAAVGRDSSKRSKRANKEQVLEHATLSLF